MRKTALLYLLTLALVVGLLFLATLHSSANAPTTATISGIVTDENGLPLNGITVGAGDYTTIAGCGPANYWASTDNDGAYQLDVPAGTYLVFINSNGTFEGYIPEAYPGINTWSDIQSASPLTVTEGQVMPGIDFSLFYGFKVDGRLVDGNDNPVLGAGGHIEDSFQNIEFGCALGFGTSDVDGTFQVNVPAGTYNLGFCNTSECHNVLWEQAISANTDLGDVLFADAPGPAFDPRPLLPGYAAETVVPGGPNTPSDVAVTSDGKIYLAAVRSWSVYEVQEGGILTATAKVGVYSLDAATDGNLYGYFMPSDPGPVYRITPSGEVTTIGYIPLTSCESTLAVAPDLDIWIGYNGCSGTGYDYGGLYRMTQSGQIYTITTDPSLGINGLDFDLAGQLYMTSANALYRVDTSNGERTLLASLPAQTASHGLVVAQDSSFYISSQAQDPYQTDVDSIFKVTPQGDVSVFAELPEGCLQGLAQTPDGDLLATMRCTGALYRVHPDGSWETVLAGNGMATPQSMAFNLNNELLVTNDESGHIVKIANGSGEFFAQVVSFISPYGFMAFNPSGNFYFSEAAPGFQPRLILVNSDGHTTEVTNDLDFPSGLAFTPSGKLYAAEYISGEVSSVSPDGTVTTFVDGFTRPQALASDSDGNLYVADYDGPINDPNDPAESPNSDRIWKIAPNGDKEKYASHNLQMMAFSPTGELYITGSIGDYSGVLRVETFGDLTPFAVGFLNPVGLAFDLAGNLYVSDDINNSITRFTGFPQGILQGIVTDLQSGLAVPNATITIVTDYPIIQGAQQNADNNGNYSIAVAPRTYTISASAEGYCETSQSTVTINADETSIVDLVLAPCIRIFLPFTYK
jgi:sugar lactone lactonase YvrE